MANLLRQFRSLIPDSPLLVGDVSAVANGILTIELPDGSYITARGAASVGQRVFVRSGLVEGLAPTLSYLEVDV
ncbi:MAG TPA: hypothetical protein PK440_07945 [Candidatus Accumulibacter phosphatis]|nr:MAG: hypothetical protein AW07_03148 [Candidatus Accumulibacter sp. SK-11]HAY29356.1 hypothetical protein [Accumulibacter sp.]HRL76321.1 hypothetical protein [Candidatus Accumulibacter phosphatis]HRQ94917.1 hypothetical protein [Candidatus Accumulibacter phosphatis]